MLIPGGGGDGMALFRVCAAGYAGLTAAALTGELDDHVSGAGLAECSHERESAGPALS